MCIQVLLMVDGGLLVLYPFIRVVSAVRLSVVRSERRCSQVSTFDFSPTYISSVSSSLALELPTSYIHPSPSLFLTVSNFTNVTLQTHHSTGIRRDSAQPLRRCSTTSWNAFAAFAPAHAMIWRRINATVVDGSQGVRGTVTRQKFLTAK
jgi:hypothetical protein